MPTREKKKPETSVSRMVEDVVGCKWSMGVLASVRAGVNRPGAIERGLPGLTTKVLNERLRKLVRYGILKRMAFPEIPPRVEYQITPFGQRFASILDLIDRLQGDLADAQTRDWK
jgi:DNA-binding HxlR family transcriptional regulator